MNERIRNDLPGNPLAWEDLNQANWRLAPGMARALGIIEMMELWGLTEAEALEALRYATKMVPVFWGRKGW